MPAHFRKWHGVFQGLGVLGVKLQIINLFKFLFFNFYFTNLTQQ